uniref:Uncharacterized protein n=1 Tax=Hanusia phi TaxID=3032 RepID=A0A7S0EZ13_9CRYP|mmetsp:Transcript_33515/g.75233  ORF Transcript_33515/g.75233 Transcript_33515/m.75233 type:complete len:596 (+) Transcript_33515:740-2527(+)
MLGLYILCTRDCRYADSSSKLFPGSDQRQRFATDLRRAVVFAAEKEANDSVNHAAIMNVEQTGTHSIRKGSVRDLLGLVDGPGTAGIYLRASWSLGETQDRYVTAGAGADQHCGRVLAGLDPSTVDFALLPPHFSREGLREVEAIGWDKFLQCFSEYPLGFRKCVPFFVASIVWHLPTLQEWFPGTHPVWRARMFNIFGEGTIGRLLQLRDKIVVVRQRCHECHMTGSGVPGKTDIMMEMQGLKENVEKEMQGLKQEMQGLKQTVTGMQDSLKQYMEGPQAHRDMGAVLVQRPEGPNNAESAATGELRQSFNSLSAQMQEFNQQVLKRLDEMQDEGRGSRRRSITDAREVDQAGRMVEQMAIGAPHRTREGMAGAEGEASREDESEMDEGDVDDETMQAADGMQAGEGHLFQWDDGSMHMVPPGFVFPTKETVMGMMSLWYRGNMRMLDLEGEVRTVRPLKHLCSVRFIGDLQQSNSQKNMWKAKYLMKEIESICRERGVLGVEEQIDATNLDKCFEASFRVLVERVYGSDAMTGRHMDKKRYGTFSYITYCNGLHKGKKDTPRRQDSVQERGVQTPGAGHCASYADMLRGGTHE